MTQDELENKTTTIMQMMVDKDGHIDVPLVADAINRLEELEFTRLCEQGDWDCPYGSYCLRVQYDNEEPYTDIIRISRIHDGKFDTETGEFSLSDIDPLPLELGNLINLVREEWTLTPKEK